MLAAQGVLTYCTNRTLPYHLYADGSGLLVLAAPLPSDSPSKTSFLTGRIKNPGQPGFFMPCELLIFAQNAI